MRYISLLLLALVAAVKADIPLPLDVEEAESRNTAASDAYRLPEDLDPIHYDVEITPYFDDNEGKPMFTFDGIVTITVEVKKAGLNALIIHENVRSILWISLTKLNGEIVQLDATNPFERIREYHFLKVNLPAGVTLVNGDQYKLTVIYVGNINETPLSRGVFRGSYTDDSGQVRWYAATHLQPTNSRQAFPSFDEPGFKSTFRIIINRLPNFSGTYSNMPLADITPTTNGRFKETFQVTPKMSAYLVTFHISEGFEVIADNNDELKPYRILARPNARGQGAYALEVGPPLTDWLSKYFGIEYYEMEKNIKNDQIASPYWASGATENWGLVTYRELRLLYQEGETNALDKLSIGTITAHELAHKWFGNLITCRWWDNVWINEGFASYFEYFAMDGVYPELELADQFTIMYLQSALSADSGTTTRALQHSVNSPTEVTGHFSGISYSKGASLLLMLKHLVTEDIFKKALQRFLQEKSYQHAFPADLYSAFAKEMPEDTSPNFDISAFMKYWVEEEGYPVLKVTVNSETGRIDLEQKRFFISATATPTEQVWPLPLTYTTQSNPNWQNLLPSKVMTTKTDSIDIAPGNGWVIFNVQQKGIYRVNYDENNWRLLANALNTDHTSIHHLNRAQIVNDVFAFMRSGQMSYALGFRVLEFLKKDTSFYSWYPAISGFNWLRNRFLHLPEKLAVFDAILYEYLQAVIADLGYDVVANEPLTRTMHRFHLLSFACNIGHRGCVDNAVGKFQDLMTNSANTVNPNLRRHVFCEGLRAGGNAEWTFLNDRRQRSNNQADEVAMLRALGCTTNDAARQQYLQNILDDAFVKAQDRVNAFTFFYMGDRSNARFALSFLKNNIAAIRNAVVLPAWFNNVLSNIAGYLDADGLTEMELWLNANQDAIPEFSAGINAIRSSRASMQWGSDNAEQIITAADNQDEDTATTTVSTPTTSSETDTESTSTSASETNPESTSESTTTSTSESTFESTSESISASTSEPITESTSESTSASEPITESTSESTSASEPITESTSESTSASTSQSTTEVTTTVDPNSAAIFMPTTMVLLWTALAMLLK